SRPQQFRTARIRIASFQTLPPTALHLLLRAYSWLQELPAPSSLHSPAFAGQGSRPAADPAEQPIRQRKEQRRPKSFPPRAGGRFHSRETEAAKRRSLLLDGRRAPLPPPPLPLPWSAVQRRDRGHQDHPRRQCRPA